MAGTNHGYAELQPLHAVGGGPGEQGFFKIQIPRLRLQSSGPVGSGI